VYSKPTTMTLVDVATDARGVVGVFVVDFGAPHARIPVITLHLSRHAEGDWHARVLALRNLVPTRARAGVVHSSKDWLC